MEITGTRGVLWVTRCTGTMLPEVAPVLMYRDGKLHEVLGYVSRLGGVV